MQAKLTLRQKVQFKGLKYLTTLDFTLILEKEDLVKDHNGLLELIESSVADHYEPAKLKSNVDSSNKYILSLMIEQVSSTIDNAILTKEELTNRKDDVFNYVLTLIELYKASKSKIVDSVSSTQIIDL